MESTPPVIDSRPPASRGRWWIHLILITSYLLVLTVISLTRRKSGHPTLSHTASGLLVVCAWELLLFGFIFGLACLSSRASLDDLLLRWRGNVIPVLLGLAYSIGLRIALGVVSALAAMILVLTHVMTLSSLQDFAAKPARRGKSS